MNTTTQPPTRPPEPVEPSPYAETGAPRAGRRKGAFVVGAALVLLLLAIGLAWTVLRGQDEPDTAPVAEAPPAAAGDSAGGLAAADLNGDGIVYQSGMHPWIVQDEPGQCPVCGMDLQPVSVRGTTGGTVEIDPVTRQNIGVRTAPVEERAVARSLRTTGTFEANERARTAVSLKVGGWVEELYVDAEGDRVRAGQPLLELYSPELVATQEEYLLALRNRDLLGGEDGHRLAEAARRRLLLFDISEAQIERLEETGEVQRTLTLSSPSGGTVVEKSVVEGMQVQPGTNLMEIVDLSQLWLQVDVPEQDLGWVGAGTAATVRVESMPGQELAGRVEYVYDTLNPATRTGTARIVVPNAGRQLKPGMYATATLTGAPSAPRLAVPSEAVIRTGDEAVVILAEGDARFRPQPVTLGPEGDGFVQVVEGLEGGEAVVTSAQFLIDSEARLAASIGSMSGASATEAESSMEMDPNQMNQ